ncbi:MAG: hypothetical protein M3Q75_02560 [Gemmatimonadota bacterium]|nr:hypothetical protein [Gemmatimonadota bacterium]
MTRRATVALAARRSDGQLLLEWYHSTEGVTWPLGLTPCGPTKAGAILEARRNEM